MRIVHVIHSLQGGGAERQLMLLANASPSQGMTAAIACLDDAGRDGLASHVGLYRLRRRRKLDWRLVSEALTAIDDFQPDLLHAWLPEVVTVPAMLAARRRGVPVVFSYRTPMKNDTLFKPVEFAATLACATGIISNTEPERCAKAYQLLYRRKRGVLIANGVEPNDRSIGCAGRSTHSGPIRLLFAGRISAEKNWQLLLNAMPLLASRCNVHLTMCGRGQQLAQAQAHIERLALHHHVRLAGYQPDLSGHMTEYDALVMPSLWEGMPNVVLEAMAAGLPCILSDIPEHRSVCGTANVAAFFDLQSTSSLIDAICSVAADAGLRLAMSDAGLRRSEDFSVSRMAARHAQAYAAVLACAA